MNMERHHDFEAIENFRDFGGYETACGRGLRVGRLYRSGHHHAATDGDLQRMRAMGVTTIVDLRGPAEREREPSRRWPGFAGAVIQNDIAPEGRDWVLRLPGAPLTPEWFFEDGLSGYRASPFEPRHLDLFRRLLRAIARSDGAVVVHCAAGKDRTGLACAFLHHVAGVAHEDIVADYLLTNDERRIHRKIKASGDFLERVAGRRPTDEALRVASSVFPEFLDAAFDEIRVRHGSLDGYLEQVLGVDAGLRAAIHDRVLG